MQQFDDVHQIRGPVKEETATSFRETRGFQKDTSDLRKLLVFFFFLLMRSCATCTCCKAEISYGGRPKPRATITNRTLQKRQIKNKRRSGGKKTAGRGQEGGLTACKHQHQGRKKDAPHLVHVMENQAVPPQRHCPQERPHDEDEDGFEKAAAVRHHEDSYHTPELEQSEKKK